MWRLAPTAQLVIQQVPTSVMNYAVEPGWEDVPGRAWALLCGSIAARGEEPTAGRVEHATDDVDPELVTLRAYKQNNFVAGWIEFRNENRLSLL